MATNNDGILEGQVGPLNGQVFDTRIILKHDSLTTWNNSTDVKLYNGEIALASIVNPSTNKEQWFIKVGNGKDYFKDLSYLSATASDVYSWAKQKDFPIEVSGTGNAITNVAIEDTLTNGFAGKKVVLTLGTLNSIAFDGLTPGGLLNDGLIVENGKIGHKLGSKTTLARTKAKFVKNLSTDNYGHLESAELGSLEIIHDGTSPITVTPDATADKWTVSHNTTTVDDSDNKDNKRFITDIEFDDYGHAAKITRGAASVTTVKHDTTGTVGVEVVPDNAADPTYTVKHAKTSNIKGTNPTKSDSTTRQYINGITFDDYGHAISYTYGEEHFVPKDTITKVKDDGAGYVTVSPNISDFTEDAVNEYTISLNTTAVRNLVAADVTAAMEFIGAVEQEPTGLGEGNNGHFYKIAKEFTITTIDKGAITAKIGDAIVWKWDKDNGTGGWYLIPSGDELEDTWRPVKVNGDDVEPDNNPGEITINFKKDGTSPINVELDKTGRNENGVSIKDIIISHNTSKQSAIDTAGLYKVKTDDYGHIVGTETVNSADIMPLVNVETATDNVISGKYVSSIEKYTTEGNLNVIRANYTEFPKANKDDANAFGIVNLGANGAEIHGTAQKLIEALTLPKLELGAGQTLKFVEQTNGSVKAEAQNISIEGSQITDRHTLVSVKTDGDTDGKAVTSVSKADDSTEIVVTHGDISTDHVVFGTKVLIFNCGTATTVI